jgi:sodium/potassium-transporting ATPase subunit alpha
MGISGTDVAKEASDMILLDDNFATIINAVEEGRAVFENIRKFIAYFFTSNVAELVPYIIYVIVRVPLPLTIMQVLAIDLGTDLLPGLALGAERPTRELMKLPPRSPQEKLLNARVLSLVFLFLGSIEATTACLTGIVIAQVANVFACRSFRESVFSIGFLTNRLIFVGIAFELVLQAFIVYHPWGNRLFSTYPISITTWLVLLPFAFVLFFAEEARKAVRRRLQPRRSSMSTLSL